VLKGFCGQGAGACLGDELEGVWGLRGMAEVDAVDKVDGVDYVNGRYEPVHKVHKVHCVHSVRKAHCLRRPPTAFTAPLAFEGAHVAF